MMALDEPAEPISGEAFEPGETLPEVPSRAMIHRFLDQQAQEIAIRSQELHIRQLEIKAGYNFSRASLNAQQTDLKDKRSEERKKRRDQLFFVGSSRWCWSGFWCTCYRAERRGWPTRS